MSDDACHPHVAMDGRERPRPGAAQFGKTALMFAALHGHEACMIALLDAGAEVEAKDEARRARLPLPPSSRPAS